MGLGLVDAEFDLIEEEEYLQQQQQQIEGEMVDEAEWLVPDNGSEI